MQRVTIMIPDDLADRIQAAADRRKKSFDIEVADRACRFPETPVSDRVVLLAGDDRATIEVLLGGLPLLDPSDLIARVRALANVRINDVPLTFTAVQLEELHRRAEKRGCTVESLLAYTVAQVSQQFFSGLRE